MPFTVSAMARIWSGVVPQQPPSDIDEAGGGEFADELRHIFRALVIEAEFIGQAGVGEGADARVGDAADLGDMLAHLARAERAVEADRERLRVRERIPEGAAVWPESVRPDRSVIVPEIMIGKRVPTSSKASSSA